MAAKIISTVIMIWNIPYPHPKLVMQPFAVASSELEPEKRLIR